MGHLKIYFFLLWRHLYQTYNHELLRYKIPGLLEQQSWSFSGNAYKLRWEYIFPGLFEQRTWNFKENISQRI